MLRDFCFPFTVFFVVVKKKKQGAEDCGPWPVVWTRWLAWSVCSALSRRLAVQIIGPESPGAGIIK
jgi:hypothetical protein